MKKIKIMFASLFLLLGLAACANTNSNKSDDSGKNTPSTDGGGTTTYTITFDSMGGSEIASITASAYPNVLPTPVKDKYEFVDWYEDMEYKSVVAEGETLTSDVTIYAKWTSYTITYQTNGGGYVAPDSDCIIPLSLPSCAKDGYTFSGWYTDEALTTKAFSGKPLDANTTLYAGWTTETKAAYTKIDDKHIYFGTYPQTLETDTDVTYCLSKAARILPTSTDTSYWTDYGYYIDGTATSYMYYIDIDTDGDGAKDYRGVYFTSYRPFYTTNDSSAEYSYQDDNGYNTNTIYWFKYEPVKWAIIATESDAVVEVNSKYLIVADLALTTMDYNYTSEGVSGRTDYQGTTDSGTTWGNNYMYSTLRNWLNVTFYEEAFNDEERALILTTEVDNSANSTGGSTSVSDNPFVPKIVINNCACDNTNDKMFSLSLTDSYNYFGVGEKRHTGGTDYAKCQGLQMTDGMCEWWTRSPGNCDVGGPIGCAIPVKDNFELDGLYVTVTYVGVRPACWISIS